MARPKHVENLQDAIDRHLQDKRNQLIWALSLQDYNLTQIGKVFNRDKATIMRIMREKPDGWRPKWIKVSDENNA